MSAFGAIAGLSSFYLSNLFVSRKRGQAPFLTCETMHLIGVFDFASHSIKDHDAALISSRSGRGLAPASSKLFDGVVYSLRYNFGSEVFFDPQTTVICHSFP